MRLRAELGRGALGVLLRRDGAEWNAGGCSSGRPERLALLGEPKKPFVGAPPPTVVGITVEPDDGGLTAGALVAIGGGVIALVAVGGRVRVHATSRCRDVNGRTIRRGLALALLLTAFVVVREPPAAHACTCRGPERVITDPQNYAGAFVGTVTDAPAPAPADRVALVTFAVEGVYLGSLPPRLTVRAELDSMCGSVVSAIGARADVVLTREGEEWVAGPCSSFPAGSLLALGARPPSDSTLAHGDSGSGTRVLVIWGSVIAVVAIGAFAVTRRRGAAK
jgi:hypothetical protein